jgi:hypothetical protein
MASRRIKIPSSRLHPFDNPGSGVAKGGWEEWSFVSCGVVFSRAFKTDRGGWTAGLAMVPGFEAVFFEGANLMQTNERVATRRQALGLALKALAVVVPVAAVVVSGSKQAEARPVDYRYRRRRRWWW